MLKIVQDSLKRPSAFVWLGAIDPPILKEWLLQHDFHIPDDLFSFWVETGGGEVYDTETILGPFGREELDEDVISVNESIWRLGLSKDYLVFHYGFYYGALRMHDQRYLQLTYSQIEAIELLAVFDTFDEWYCGTLRELYAKGYKLD